VGVCHLRTESEQTIISILIIHHSYTKKINIMTILLTPQESETYFHNALCNGLGEMRYYGLSLEVDGKAYKKAKAKLHKEYNSTCYEDVLLQILKDGGTLTMVDDECDGEYTRSITIKNIHDRVAMTPLSHLMDMVNEQDDATTGEVILQSVFYEEVIFG